MGPETLAQVLRPLTETLGAPPDDLLVGLGRADDAAVYRLSDEQAIVATLDFFPPVVDDPEAFGAIAAANALSDIYAMGAQPLFALNLVGFPSDLDNAILTEILRGGAAKVREAGAIIAGGHSVIDAEPKYGLAVIGTVHPDRILTKGGAREGDALLLTKPLGTGIVTTAAKREAAPPDVLAAAIASMTRLNASAASVLRGLGTAVHACTDITGFGLLGHGLEMAEQSGLALVIESAALPLLPGVEALAEAGHVPGGTERNTSALAARVTFAGDVSEALRVLCFDPQTSGGLLAALAPDAVERALVELAAVGVEARQVGTVVAGEGARVL